MWKFPGPGSNPDLSHCSAYAGSLLCCGPSELPGGAYSWWKKKKKKRRADPGDYCLWGEGSVGQAHRGRKSGARAAPDAPSGAEAVWPLGAVLGNAQLDVIRCFGPTLAGCQWLEVTEPGDVTLEAGKGPGRWREPKGDCGATRWLREENCFYWRTRQQPNRFFIFLKSNTLLSHNKRKKFPNTLTIQWTQLWSQLYTTQSPQKVNQLNVPNISRRGFSKLPLVFGKTSMEVHIHWLHWTTFASIKVSNNISLHLASWSMIWSHTLKYIHRSCPPGSRQWGARAVKGEAKASPGCGVSHFVTEVWEFNTRTLSSH